MVEATDGSTQFSPDGLTEAVIDALIVAVDEELAEMPAPTSRLLDGAARKRWDRRYVDRTLSGAVRVLAARDAMPVPTGTEAA
ncbi:hypothetical protein [Saccharothrix deserti]|uniref:hypothetical protein n=1 Tax=Saccharothrix deserti TaxID=2593674 RepID=UPI00131EA2A0|nr:hypothetical protein [Saccharothrix deserti]